MKKVDNFDASKWLVENKITTQSRLNEAKDPDSVVSQEARDMFYNAVAKVMKDLYQADIMDNDIIDDYLGTEGGLLGDAIEAFLHPEDLDESRLNEEESNDVLTQEDFDILGNKGFEINFTQPRHQLFWLERKLNAERADFRYLENLLNKKNIPFRIEKRGYDGRGAAAKEIWIDTKYTDVPNPKIDTNESRLNEDEDLFTYNNRGQGSGSDSKTQKGTSISVNDVEPEMNVIISYDYDGGQGSGSQGTETLSGKVKSVTSDKVFISIDDAKLNKYTKKYQAMYKKDGKGISKRDITKITTL
jgi:hypothetical protein